MTKEIENLLNWWKHREEECERMEQRFLETDRVSTMQCRACKEVYMTCQRELKMALGIKE